MADTENISLLAASTDISQTQRANSTQRQVNPAPTQESIQQIRQISSEAGAGKAKVDKERAPESPKKPDAGYSPQEDKEDYQFQKNYGKKSNSSKKSKHLELVA
jgi:hypothetical protein